jgi:hypothetical protein
MKSRRFFILMLASAILLPACQKDQPGSVIYPDNGKKLKQILLYPAIDSETPMAIVEEYEYNENGKIAKTTSPMYDNGVIVGTISYNIYEYNAFDQLSQISNYNANLNSPSGFINLNNTLFTYFADGKIATKTIEDQNGSVYEFYLYEYKGDQLVKISKFDKEKLESYTVNDYDGSGRLTRETFYIADGQCISYTINIYSGMLQIRSDLYTFQKNSMYRTINRTFDSDGNLLILESKELFAYSNMMSFVYRYKYYE